MATGDTHLVWQREGARQFWIEGRSTVVTEAGVSSLTGFGTVPTGRSVYAAARGTRVRIDGAVTMRVTGVMRVDLTNPYYKPGLVGHAVRVMRMDVVEDFEPLRFGEGGSGSPDDTRKLPLDDSDYPNTFLRVISEETSVGWAAVTRVQFIA